METNERTGDELPDLTALDDAILAVLSPRLRRLIEEGPSEESGASYVKCGRCRDTGWVETPEGNVRCPHAAKEDRRIRLEHHIRESGTSEFGRTQTFETFDVDKCADPDTVRALEFLTACFMVADPLVDTRHARRNSGRLR